MKFSRAHKWLRRDKNNNRETTEHLTNVTLKKENNIFLHIFKVIISVYANSSANTTCHWFIIQACPR